MADYDERLSFTGQVNVLTADLYSYSGVKLDITAIIGELSLYEDLFSNTMSGRVLLQDALDLINNFPLIGQELLVLKLQTPTVKQTISKTFYVYKLQHRTHKERVQTYVLNFCSKELIASANSKVAKSYSGNIAGTVSEIFKDERYLSSKSKLNTEATKNSYSFIAPYWSPLETINWLSGKSLNGKGVPNYLFYESNQSFEFVSVDSLIQKEPVREYIFNDIDGNTVYGVNGDKESKYKIVESMDTAVTFDYLRNLNAGMYSSMLYTYDATTKGINRNTFDYIDDFGKSSHLEKVPLKTPELLRKKISSIYFIEKNNYQIGKFQPQGYKYFFLQRNSLLEQLSAFKVSIRVHGRTDVMVGQTITFKINQFRKIVADEIDTTAKSDYFSGKHLITAIHHQFINGNHTMDMEIISDSFIKNLVTKI